MPESTSNRDALTSRTLPQMQLSDGSAGSLTGPPAPGPYYLDARGNAERRFAVEGSAIVTGGFGALGLACARALLEHGAANVALFDTDFSLHQLEALERDFAASGATAGPAGSTTASIIAKRVDVTDPAAVADAVAETAHAFGGVDILLCFAGVVGCVHALETDPALWRRILDVNTTGSFLVSQAVARLMKEQGTGGSIVLTASYSAHRVNFPQPQAAYNTSKAAVLALKSSLAAEWARYGIRVNSISPGYMDTVLNEGPGLEESRRIWQSRNPMGRMGLPSEITGPVILLCSQAGSYINGADITIDGGASVF